MRAPELVQREAHMEARQMLVRGRIAGLKDMLDDVLGVIPALAGRS
ncbi:MAG: hypothetical protein ACRDPM_15915 [Solirubrobacteraceae bacterium]